MIILEGPDGAGKTTLLHQIISLSKGKFKVAQKAVDSEGKPVVKNMAEYIENELAKGWQKKLYDRFALISGPIYGQFTDMASPNEIFQDRVWHFNQEAALLRLAPLIVYCLPALPIIRTNLLVDPASQGVVGANLTPLYYAYQARAARDCALGVGVVYDYTSLQGLNIVMARIRLRLKQEGIF